MNAFVWMYEWIARFYGYNADRVPDWLVGNYARVERYCGDLSSAAHAFYAALGLC